MADDDIFMDYAASSPLDEQVPVIKFNIPKSGSSFDEILNERLDISSYLKNQITKPANPPETRLKILQLRRFNRLVSNIITDHRKRLNELKDVVDNLNNKLLCQKFEKQHLLDEIKACLNSKNIFESIDLEPVESESSALSSHELMIKRLQGELAKRQELQSRLVSILQKKQQTEMELEKKKRKMEDLRNHLQNLLKNSKPLVEACGYDLEAFHRKKMAIDDASTTESSTSIEDLSAVYEKLVTFVADKPDYKLRYFESLVQENDEEDAEISGRNSLIKSAYIQIILELRELESVDILLRLQQAEDQSLPSLLLSIHHEMIPENSVASWLKSLGTIEFDSSSSDSSAWLAPSKLQPDSLNFVQDSEAFEQVFTAIKEALQVRSQLLGLLQTNEHLLELDKNAPNELVLLPAKNIKAQMSMNSIVWTESQEGAGMNDEMISTLNSIGSKYRSVLDCLQSQLEILSKQQQ